MAPDIILFVPFALAILAELLVTRRLGKPSYERGESELSLGLLIGTLVAGYALGAAIAWSAAQIYALRIAEPAGWTLGGVPIAPVLLFLVADLIYYWVHRLSHLLPWGWATHAVHHSATRLNFLASQRQGWTELISGIWVLWLLLALLGFPPADWLAYTLVLAAWQFWVHNEWAGRLGPLEWVLVTPAHHRVHHSIDPAHVDHNYGGLLIVWDRLFGTFADEGARRIARFGLADPAHAPGSGPATVAFAEWRAMLRRGRRRERQVTIT